MLKPEKIKLSQEDRDTVIGLLELFQIDGEQASKIITPGQIEIFASIVLGLNNRIEIICATQYGKSLVVALTAVILSCIMAKTVAVVAPGEKQARIIMRYYIEHLGDDKLFLEKLLPEDRSTYSKLVMEKSKTRITLNNGGGVFILSAQSKFVSKSIEAAMGQGAEIVLLDEACLISDDTEATIFRMITGKTGKFKEAMYVKIGNPFYRNHFYKDWEENERFLKILIDGDQGIKEGRYKAEDLEEAEGKPLYNILYRCEFPSEDEIDDKGYRQLLTSESVNFASSYISDINDQTGILGCDIGGGGDLNVYVIRKGGYIWIESYNKSSDTMINVSEILRIMKKHNILDTRVNIDGIGLGRGVVDRLKEMTYDIRGIAKHYRPNSVIIGSSVKDDGFMNLKSELSWKLKLWSENPKNKFVEVSKGIIDKLRRNPWLELFEIKWKVNTEKQVRIEPKEDMVKRTKKSPDFADAAVLTMFETIDTTPLKIRVTRKKYDY